MHRLHQDFRVCGRSLPCNEGSRVRSFVPGYEMEMARNLEETLERLAREPGVWKPFAGGTDLMVLLEAGKLPHRRFLNIWKLPELHGIEGPPAHFTLGARTTYPDF